MNPTVERLLDKWLQYRLRIAATVLCLFACGWLAWAWISSYYSPSRMQVLPILSWKGVLTINPGVAIVGTAYQDIELFSIPHWPVVLVFGALAALPWVQWSRRYSLRAFFIITTLIALLLGVAAISY